MDSEIEVKLVSSKELIEQIASMLNASGSNSQVVKTNTIEENTQLGFDLSELAYFATIVSGLGAIPVLSSAIYAAFAGKNDQKIIVQTPFRRVEIQYTKFVTEEEIQKALEQLIEVPK